MESTTSFQEGNKMGDLRPRVLVCLGTYLPGYKAGGPIRSVENLVAKLGNEFDFRIVTSDRDLGEKVPFPGIVTNQWVRVGQADVLYLPPGVRGLLHMCVVLCSVDENTVLYLNSFFSPRFSILEILLNWLKVCRPRRVVIAPRGEFSLGALHLNNRKKRWYIRCVRPLRLYQDVHWQASSGHEAADITRQFPQTKQIEIAGNLSGQFQNDSQLQVRGKTVAPEMEIQSQPAHRKIPGCLRALFVSRISRKKNLSGALAMLKGISGKVLFDIYGPAEDGTYWEECQALVAELPANVQVTYCGEIEHEKLGGVFAGHELLIFPTLGENYGHVICEALISGCPVLISDQTPWRDLEAEGVGWAIPLSDTKRFRAVLQQCVDGDAQWHARMSARALNYAAKLVSDPQTVRANRTLFQGAWVGTNGVGHSTVRA
jgi:glycosyltransferase involved in cell wall biosynthesis